MICFHLGGGTGETKESRQFAIKGSRVDFDALMHSFDNINPR
jgi:hypothetical protein